MALVWVGEENEDGLRKVMRRHFRPERLSEESRAEGIEIEDEQLREPEEAKKGQATAYLDSDNNVVWEIKYPVDIDGALDAMEDTLSRGRVRAILRDYPDVLSAMSRGWFERAWEGLADAHEAGDLSDDDMDALRRIGAEHNIPLPENT